MTYLFLVCFFILCETKSGAAGDENTGERFGTFTPIVKSVSLCKGPRRNNCSSVRLDLSHDVLTVKLSVKKDTKLEEVKVVVTPRAGAAGGAVRWRIADPCRHAFFGPVLAALYRTRNNCVVDKGPLQFSANLPALIQQLSGSRFFYGTFFNRLLIMSSQCNMICIETLLELRKG